MGDNGKSVNKHFRLSKQEADMLKAKATDMDMNETDYLRFLISQKPRDYPEIEQLLNELVNEVNKIGVNINQIVKNHNSKFYTVEDKRSLTAHMKKLNSTVKEAVKVLGNQ